MSASSYNLRKRGKPASTSSSVPDGFARLDEFNASKNKYGQFSGIKGTGVDESTIWVKEYAGSVLLWWEDPYRQVDDFIYTGKSQTDIDDCNAEHGMKSGYTWHHTGYPTDEAYGTMQLVPTYEHERLSHVGGAMISRGGKK